MSRTFKVRIIRATNLKAADSNGKSDPYVRASLVSDNADAKPVELYKTQVIHKSLDPEWNEEFTVEVPVTDRDLFYDYPIKFEVFDKDLVGKDYLGDFTFNFGYHWTAALGTDEEIPIKLPLKQGFLHLTVTMKNKGYVSLEDLVCRGLHEPIAKYERVTLKTRHTVGTLVMPNHFQRAGKNDAAGNPYVLYASSKTLDRLSTSVTLTEETGPMHTLKGASNLAAKVATILDNLHKEGAWEWYSPTEEFKIDDENIGLTVSYRKTSSEGQLFTVQYFFYLVGTTQFYTLTHTVNVKTPAEQLSPEQWEAFSKETVAEAKNSLMNGVVESLKLFPVATYTGAEVVLPARRKVLE